MNSTLIGHTSRRWITATLIICALAAWSAVSAATAGAVDLSFGVAGSAQNSFPSAAWGRGIAAQADGKLVVAGGFGFTVARYTADGALDPTFGNGGVLYAELSETNTDAIAVAVQPDGKIVIAGSGRGAEHGIIVLRLNPNGSRDTSFGINGVGRFEYAGTASTASSLALQPNGGIVVAGTVNSNTNQNDIIVVRFATNGKVDLNFGNAGAVTVRNGPTSYGNAVVTLPDNRILVGGTTYDPPIFEIPNWDFIMARFNNDGTFDNTFAAGGLLVTSIGPGIDGINGLALQPDGKIVATGTVQSDNMDLAIVRYTAAGQLDVGNFGSGGKLLVDFNSRADYGTSVAIDPSGYIVAAGYSGGEFNADISLVRCEPDGDLDPNFGTNGKARHNYSQANDYVYGMLLQPTTFLGQPSGYKIITTGASDSPYFHFVTIRYQGRSGPIDRAVVNDFDGDRLSELALFRPPTGDWIIGKVPPTGTVTQVTTIHWGALGDKVVPGDYDGDGKYDLGVYRGGVWHILTSGNKYLVYTFGLSSDIPMPADYDGDGRTDVAVFRPPNGVWYYIRSSDNSFVGAQWGLNGDIPVVGDYDRDDRADLAVFRGGVWYILQSGSNQMRVEYFGLATDKPVPFDFDQDGKIDLAVFRAGDWYYVSSDNGVLKFYHWGQSSDIPIPGRYGTPSGIAFNHGGQWWLLDRDIVWVTGPDGDIPVPTFFAQ